MANRIATHILKHSNVLGRPLPSTLLGGEPIVNTADGIMYFSGVTASSNGWTPAGTGTTANFFEVGSNLYDLQIRNKITKYEGVSGSGLVGKFLSGTTNGFVLSNIADIAGVDTFTTGFTYSNNVATIKRNLGLPDLSITIDTMTGLTVNGVLSATTGNFATTNITDANVTTLGATGGTITTLGSTTANLGTANVTTLGATGGTITTLGSTTANLGTANVTTLNASAGTVTTLGSTTANLGTANVTTLNATGGTVTTLDTTALSATGGTITTLDTTTLNLGKIAKYSELTDLSGKFLSGTTSGFELGNISDIVGVDTFVTGFTYSPTTNTITLSQNVGQADKTISINIVSGLTVSNLTEDRIVYTTANGKLVTGTAIFDGTDMTLPTAGSLNVGSGGINTTGSLVIGGDLTVLGTSVSAFTSQLYVEDNNIYLNYNPTGDTEFSSIGAGWTIQDGNGLFGGDVNLDIRAMNGFSGITSSNVPDISEYTSSNGYSNRAFVTQLNDIVIRSTNMSTPNGVRVLAEFDVIDGGTY
jgi:hypothetical protein